MYEMWRSGVSLVVWWTIRDFATADSTPGGGLYDRNGRPKLTVRAYGFPVIAAVNHGRGFVWGRVPFSHPVDAVIERETGKRWIRIGTVHTGPDGVFTLTFAANRNGIYRARIPGGPSSLPYDSTPIPPKRIHLL